MSSDLAAEDQEARQLHLLVKVFVLHVRSNLPNNLANVAVELLARRDAFQSSDVSLSQAERNGCEQVMGADGFELARALPDACDVLL